MSLQKSLEISMRNQKSRIRLIKKSVWKKRNLVRLMLKWCTPRFPVLCSIIYNISINYTSENLTFKSLPRKGSVLFSSDYSLGSKIRNQIWECFQMSSSFSGTSFWMRSHCGLWSSHYFSFWTVWANSQSSPEVYICPHISNY